MRIGMFGGTFNPIHSGHLQAAKKTMEVFGLDKIYFIPSALPPHKTSKNLANASDRLEMTELATAGRPGFAVSDVELKRDGASYTIDTVKHFKKNLKNLSELCLILGMDAFFEIETWRSYKRIFDLVSFVVMTRFAPGDIKSGNIRAAETDREPERLKFYIKSRISSGYEFFLRESCFLHDNKFPIYFCDVSPFNISSTEIRNRIKSGQGAKSLTPQAVEDFIKRKGLYLNEK